VRVLWEPRVNRYSVIDHSKVPAEPPLGVINFLTQLYRQALSLVFVSVNCRRLDYALRLHPTISTFRSLAATCFVIVSIREWTNADDQNLEMSLSFETSLES